MLWMLWKQIPKPYMRIMAKMVETQVMMDESCERASLSEADILKCGWVWSVGEGEKRR